MKKTSSISAMVLMSAALTLSACGENKSAEQYIADSQTLLQAKDYNKAIIQLKNAIQIAPKDANTRLLLGQAYLQLGNYTSAKKELEKAVELGLSLPQVAAPLVQAMSKMNEFDEVYNFVDETSALSAEHYLVVLTYAGITAMNQGEQEKAADYLEQALSLSEDSPYTALADGYINYLNKQYPASLALARDLLATTPDFTEALLLEGYTLMAMKEFEQASQAFVNYVSYHHEAHYVRLLEVNALIGAQDLDQAQLKIDKLLKVFQEAPLALQLKAQIAFLKKEYDIAFEYAEKAINSGLDYQLTRLISGISAFKLKRFETAYQHLNNYVDSLPPESDLLRLFTFLQLKLGYEQGALESIEEFDELSEIDGELFAEAAMQVARSGDVNKAKELIAKANQLDENNTVNLLREGLLKLQTADISGVDELEAAIKSDAEVNSAWLTIALAHLQNNDLSQALVAAEKWQQVSPADGLVLKAIIYYHSKQNIKAIEMLNEALAIEPTHMGGQLNLIRVAMKINDNALAMQTAKNILAAKPDHLKSMVVIISLLRAEDKLADAKAFIQAHMQAHPSLLAPKIAMAIVYRHENQSPLAIELLSGEKARLSAIGWKILGDSQLYARKFEDALETFTEWKELSPNILESWLKIIATLDVLKRDEEAYSTIKSAEKVFPEHAQLLLLKLHFQTELGFLSDAKKTLLTLKNNNVASTLMDRLEGELALASGDLDIAEELLLSYYNSVPSIESATLVAEVLKSKGQVQQAGELLKKEYERGNKSLKGLFTLAKFFSSTEQYDEANRYYFKVLEYRPKNIIALNNLALNMLKLNQLEQADKYAEAAFKQMPNHPAVLDTLGWIKVQKGEHDKGLEYLTQAYGLAPESQEIKNHYQQAKELSGN
ncbi:putative PEP-CTERM system TPR-repeat lipoprotein [Colwellia chukchiensis]|uniref:Putative PEP-CTERM system TPR-repeat lipoprotein n=1 Tax=Colwellia chukchiensis TaxID=641665 RepID=A0A1H7T5F4_9GAMM|nr:XrtA/PEP-CTERM system TPR-repeat protein PrsT [Colwellia chukchiensis]SEL80081.1 putative PEP-CTERM system TPR-repeat lipoprotein [Colwellia chukchiensis]